MGPNGQAQYWAPTFPEACAVLMRHYELHLRRARRAVPAPSRRRSTRSTATCAPPRTPRSRTAPSAPSATCSPPTLNPERKQPFDMRSVMRAVADIDTQPLERWKDLARRRDRDRLGRHHRRHPGVPARPGVAHDRRARASCPPTARRHGRRARCSRSPRARRPAPSTRPAATGRSSCSPTCRASTARRSRCGDWQLEYGAEIGRAVTNFDGPDRLRRRLALPRRRLRGVLQGAQRGDGDRRRRGLLRLRDRRRAGGGDGVRPRGQAAHRRRTRGFARRARPLAAATGADAARLRGALAEVTERGALGEAGRGGRRVRRDPHHRAGAARRVGRPDHRRARRCGPTSWTPSSAAWRAGAESRAGVQASGCAARSAPARRRPGRRRRPGARVAATGRLPAMVSRKTPSRRHQPGNTDAIPARHRQGAPAIGVAERAQVDLDLRVSARSPTLRTFSAASLADQIRLAASSRAAPAAGCARRRSRRR